VTGALGAAALALDGFRAGAPPVGALRQRFARPEPRIAAGNWLARHGARAMIDISDGLAADAGHLAAASGIALEIDLDRVPCWSGASPRAAAASGEDYELLVALPREFVQRNARAFTRATGLALTAIGRCARGKGVRLTQAGRAVPAPGGFDHFAEQ
jgi:thiamine-monophosphate kinase